LDYSRKKYGGAAMFGKLARGTYVVFVTAMIVAWVFSLGKEVPAEPQPTQEITYANA
jgi:hypothetical protein